MSLDFEAVALKVKNKGSKSQASNRIPAKTTLDNVMESPQKFEQVEALTEADVSICKMWDCADRLDDSRGEM